MKKDIIKAIKILNKKLELLDFDDDDFCFQGVKLEEGLLGIVFEGHGDGDNGNWMFIETYSYPEYDPNKSNVENIVNISVNGYNTLVDEVIDEEELNNALKL